MYTRAPWKVVEIYKIIAIFPFFYSFLLFFKKIESLKFFSSDEKPLSPAKAVCSQPLEVNIH